MGKLTGISYDSMRPYVLDISCHLILKPWFSKLSLQSIASRTPPCPVPEVDAFGHREFHVSVDPEILRTAGEHVSVCGWGRSALSSIMLDPD